jgi:hypothetical protein
MIQIFSHKVGLVFRISNTMKNLHNHIVVHYHPIGWTQHPPLFEKSSCSDAPWISGAGCS